MKTCRLHRCVKIRQTAAKITAALCPCPVRLVKFRRSDSGFFRPYTALRKEIGQPILLSSVCLCNFFHSVRDLELITAAIEIPGSLDGPRQDSRSGLSHQNVGIVRPASLCGDSGPEWYHDQPPPGAGVCAAHSWQVVGKQAQGMGRGDSLRGLVFFLNGDPVGGASLLDRKSVV